MAKGSDNSFGIISVIFGTLSLIFSISIILGSFPGVILGVLGLIFALIQRKKSNNLWARWGMILSILGIVMGLILLLLFISALTDLAEQIQTSGALNPIQGAI